MHDCQQLSSALWQQPGAIFAELWQLGEQPCQQPAVAGCRLLSTAPVLLRSAALAYEAGPLYGCIASDSSQPVATTAAHTA